MFKNYKDIHENIKGEKKISEGDKRGKKISEGNCKLFFIKL
jgi:hypothetical protein